MAIDCVLCFRDDSGSFYINAYVAILSIFSNTKEKIVVHILHDETIEHGRSHLEELCASFGHEIRFHRVPELNLDKHSAEIIAKRFNIGATYLYYTHEFVDAAKAVYLDCDIIFNRDIKELYDLELADYMFAAALDYGPYWRNGQPRKKHAKKISYFGLKEEIYFNSGLILMNLDKIRALPYKENIFVKRTLAAISDGIALDYPDMDVLNAVAAEQTDGVLVLDDSFNLWHRFLHLSLEELKDTIFHFIIKPHNNFYPAHLLFWKYYAKSPFAGDMFERMSEAYGSEAMRFVRLYCLNSKRRRQAEDYLEVGLWGMLGRSLKRRLGLAKKK